MLVKECDPTAQHTARHGMLPSRLLRHGTHAPPDSDIYFQYSRKGCIFIEALRDSSFFQL